MKHPYVFVFTLSMLWTVTPAFAEPASLIVVDDKGGTSALPYYQALKLPQRTTKHPIKIPQPPTKPFSEADMLPVQSTRLTPGVVHRRSIEAPGLMPFFLVGDDDLSRAWLREREPFLRQLNAVGLVVNVSAIDALTALRQQVPNLSLAPVSGDDLAERLGLRHYPVLITATGIEQ